MYLRSDTVVNAGSNRPRDLVTIVSTEESVNQDNLGHLSVIREEGESETSSEQDYLLPMAGMDMNYAGVEDAFTSQSHDLRFGPPLHYLRTNKNGARIYLDVDNQHYVQENIGNLGIKLSISG